MKEFIADGVLSTVIAANFVRPSTDSNIFFRFSKDKNSFKLSFSKIKCLIPVAPKSVTTLSGTNTDNLLSAFKVWTNRSNETLYRFKSLPVLVPSTIHD